MKTERFTPQRVEELLQASNDLTDGKRLTLRDATDLAHLWRDEADRLLGIYTQRMGEIMLLATGSMPHPDHWKNPTPQHGDE